MSCTTPTARLFLALWPDPDVRRDLAAMQQRWTWPPGAALVREDRLHLTLHFLGSVPVDRVPGFVQALAVDAQPMRLDLSAGSPRVWPGGVAVLELDAPPALLRLHAALADALAGLGWPVERRRFRPHVTFARRARGAQPPDGVPAHLVWPAGPRYVLARSVPGRGYDVVHAFD